MLFNLIFMDFEIFSSLNDQQSIGLLSFITYFDDKNENYDESKQNKSKISSWEHILNHKRAPQKSLFLKDFC